MNTYSQQKKSATLFRNFTPRPGSNIDTRQHTDDSRDERRCRLQGCKLYRKAKGRKVKLGKPAQLLTIPSRVHAEYRALKNGPSMADTRHQAHVTQGGACDKTYKYKTERACPMRCEGARANARK